jgi:hypothetical protein
MKRIIDLNAVDHRAGVSVSILATPRSQMHGTAKCIHSHEAAHSPLRLQRTP